MTSPSNCVPDTHARWRERHRFVLAIVAITLLYLGIEEAWLWGASQLAHTGWTVNDPAESYAAEALEIAEKSRQREATLAPGFQQQVFALGYEYGYLSQWLGGYLKQTDEDMRLLSRPVAAHTRHLNQLAEQLGVAPAARLPMQTVADFKQLTQRIEEDPSGLAGRVEQVGSLRLRHVFLFGAHVGTEAAGLEAKRDLTPPPATGLIGMHATLASIPEALWRPLARVSRGSPAEIRRDYYEAIARLENAWK